MLDIPEWLKETIGKYNCPNCAHKMLKKNIVSVGIRYSAKYPRRTVFFFEYDCKNCNQKVAMEMNFMSVEEYVLDMMSQYSDDGESNKKKTKKRKTRSRKKSGIPLKELKAMREFIRDVDSMDEFLGALGFTREEIENNNQIGRDEFKKRNKRIK